MKRNMNVRKTLALLLTAALMLGMLVIPASATGFSDVSSTASYLDAVNYVSDNGIMTGTSSTKFSPSTTATRAMFVTVLYRKAGSPEPSQSASFSDVVSTAYYANAVAWAQHDSKIVSGTSSSLFSPNDSITREAAVTMLYRYAVYCDIDVSATTSITGYSDYSSVSTYARTAMAWAVATGVTTGTTSTTLSPKGTLTRAQIAVFITRFGTNVEKIICKEDNFRFTNSSSAFTSSEYYISSTHLGKLKNLANTYWGDDTESYNKFLKDLKDLFEESRDGSCFGMSTVVALDKMGKIAFNENYYPSASKMYSVKLTTGSQVESVINYYHLAQYVDSETLHGDRSTAKTVKADVTYTMTECANNNGISMLSYYWKDDNDKNHGHTVLVNSVSKSGSTYTLKVCNPNFTSEQTITITSAGVLNGATQLTKLRVLTDFSVFNIFDIDGYTNTDSSASVSAAASIEAGSELQSAEEETSVSLQNSLSYDTDDTSLLMVSLVSAFTVTNAEGEYLYWDGSQLTGTMEVYSESETTEGEDAPSNLIVAVPESGSFCFEPQASVASYWFSATSPECYCRVSGTNITQATADMSGAIELSGEDMEFGVAYGSGDADSPLYILSGANSDSVAVTGSGDGLEATGVSGLCTVEAIDGEGGVESIEVYAGEDGTLSVS